MSSYRFFFLVILLFPIFKFYLSPWFFPYSLEELLVISGISILAGIGLNHPKIRQKAIDWNWNSESVMVAIGVIAGILFLLFPIRSIDLGDGLGIHENIALETGAFGFQLTMDEFLSAMTHSLLYRFLFSKPEFAYRFTSTLTGFIVCYWLYRFLQRNKGGVLEYLIVLSSAGMILFFGYVENYSIPTLLILLLIGINYSHIQSGKTEHRKVLILSTILASIAFLFHLVEGYLLFSLVYLAYILSDRDFIKNSLWSVIIALLIIVPPLAYFLFFAGVRFDLSMTHIAHPPIYPIQRMFSLNHFKEIAGCLFFSTGFSFLILLYSFVYKRKELKEFIQKKENKFLLLLIFGFLLHTFTFNPLLGYPKDWDVMSLYWLPISIFSALFVLANFERTEKLFLLPLLLFFLLNLGLVVKHYHKLEESKSKELDFTLNTVEEYLKESRGAFSKISSDNAKYFLKIDFFLFKNYIELNHIENEKNKDSCISLKDLNLKYRAELKDKILNSPDKKWKKEYLDKLTEYHKKLLQIKSQSE